MPLFVEYLIQRRDTEKKQQESSKQKKNSQQIVANLLGFSFKKDGKSMVNNTGDMDLQAVEALLGTVKKRYNKRVVELSEVTSSESKDNNDDDSKGVSSSQYPDYTFRR